METLYLLTNLVGNMSSKAYTQMGEMCWSPSFIPSSIWNFLLCPESHILQSTITAEVPGTFSLLAWFEGRLYTWPRLYQSKHKPKWSIRCYSNPRKKELLKIYSGLGVSSSSSRHWGESIRVLDGLEGLALKCALSELREAAMDFPPVQFILHMVLVPKEVAP